MEYKDRIKRARKHAGLTQGQLADAVGYKAQLLYATFTSIHKNKGIPIDSL